MAVYLCALDYGDTVLGMSLSEGGHLTHGHKLNFSGKSYNFVSYGVDENTHLIDYEQVKKIAIETKPKLIVAGASAYSRAIDFKKFKEIADLVEAYLMVDMAHIAGLVAAGLHQNPVEYADFITTTTHKTLRGPRGGMILCKEEFAKKIDSIVFPGMQGGPLMHVIAGKAACLQEALQPDFIEYQKNVIENAKLMAKTFINEGFKVISGGTDNHLLLIDIKTSVDLTGAQAEKLLEEINITTNKNTIPMDTLSPVVTSGLRIGTPAITTRGLNKEDVIMVAKVITSYLKNHESEQVKNDCLNKIKDITSRYPLYPNLKY